MVCREMRRRKKREREREVKRERTMIEVGGGARGEVIENAFFFVRQTKEINIHRAQVPHILGV